MARTTTNGAKNGRAHQPPPPPMPELEAPAAPSRARGSAKASKNESASVNLLPIDIVHTVITVRGISSLIVNNWSEKAKQEMRDKQMGKAKQKREPKDPKKCFVDAAYIDTRGVHCVPALAFKNAIVCAARFADDMKMTVLRGAIFVEGTHRLKMPDGSAGASDYLPIKSKPPIMREDMVRVGQGTADLRYRPEYHDWSVDLPIQFNQRVITLEQLVNLVKVAGFGVGICEWRPERNGQHGRFDVDIKSAKNRVDRGGPN